MGLDDYKQQTPPETGEGINDELNASRDQWKEEVKMIVEYWELPHIPPMTPIDFATSVQINKMFEDFKLQIVSKLQTY